MPENIPQQVRSVDPFQDFRFSNNYNIRSRIITGGKKNVVLYESSFKLEKVNDYTIKIHPGLAIVDDVFIHIYEEKIYDLRNNNIYIDNEPLVNTSLPSTDSKYRHLQCFPLFLHYNYVRAKEIPKAKYVILKNVGTQYNKDYMVYLGYIAFRDNKILFVSNSSIMLDNENRPVRNWNDPNFNDNIIVQQFGGDNIVDSNDPTIIVLYVPTIIPNVGVTELNGGVLFYENPGDPDPVWRWDWAYNVLIPY